MGEDSSENEKGSSSGVGGSRWNPTKEQIELLERMYSHEGIRTPTADQIQQITVRLQAFGPIEGKNVFYWFQNHKARQRQKQKQELLAAQQIFLPPHHPPPFHHHRNHNHHHLPNCATNLNFNPKTLFPTTNPYNHYHHQYLPISPNSIKRPYYQAPQTIYPPPTQQHNYGASGDHVDGYNRRSKVVSFGDHRIPFGSAVNGYSNATMMMNYTTKSSNHRDVAHCHRHDQEDSGHCRCMETRTLNLFPVHPTGILEHKLGSCSTTNNSVNTSDDDTYMNDSGTYQRGPEMFDFFSSGHASSNETYHD